jgi:hypothetical protein
MTFQAASDARLMRAVVRSLQLRTSLFVVVPVALLALVLARTGHGEGAIETAGGAVAALVVPWAMASQVVERQSAVVGLMRAYRIDRIGITVSAGFGTKTTPWSAVTGVRRWRGQVAVSSGWRKVMGIPTGSLTKQEQARLLGILRSRGADV